MRQVNLGFGLDFLKEQVKFNIRFSLNSFLTSADNMGPLLAISNNFLNARFSKRINEVWKTVLCKVLTID